MIEQPQNETKRAVDYDELFPGRFLKAALLGGKQWNIRIADVHVEKLPSDKGPQWRGVISFRRTELQLVLNRTNGEALKAMFGRNVEEWIGKIVTLYPTMVDVGGSQEMAIRVFGSPDIAADVRFTLALPRRKPREVLLRRTGSVTVQPPTQPQAAPAAPSPTPAAPAPAREPGSDDDDESTPLQFAAG